MTTICCFSLMIADWERDDIFVCYAKVRNKFLGKLPRQPPRESVGERNNPFCSCFFFLCVGNINSRYKYNIVLSRSCFRMQRKTSTSYASSITISIVYERRTGYSLVLPRNESADCRLQTVESYLWCVVFSLWTRRHTQLCLCLFLEDRCSHVRWRMLRQQKKKKKSRPNSMKLIEKLNEDILLFVVEGATTFEIVQKNSTYLCFKKINSMHKERVRNAAWPDHVARQHLMESHWITNL